MRWVGHVPRKVKEELNTEFLWGNLLEISHFENGEARQRIILKLILWV